MTDARGKGADCIRRAIAAGEVDAVRGGKAIRAIEEIEADYYDALGPIGAKRQANVDYLEQLSFENALKKRARLMQLAAQERITSVLDKAARSKNVDLTKLARGLVDSTGMKELGYRGAVQEMRRVRSMAHRMLADVLANYRTHLGGFSRNKASQVNMLREIKGEATGDVAARDFARAWTETSETLRQMFNANGGAIPKLKQWDLPQNHDVLKIRKGGYQTWRDTIAPLLDRSQMIDRASGKPMNDVLLERVLRDVHSSITTRGWDMREPSGVNRSTSFAMRHAHARVLHFKDADGWLTYHEQFGSGDIFGAMMNHVDNMAREIGAMRALGPNPRSTITYVGQVIEKRAALSGSAKAENKAAAVSQKLDTLYSHYIGDANAPVDGTLARAFSSTRQFLTAAQLGSAVLSAITDVGFSRITARFNGLKHWKIMGRQLKLLNPASDADRKLAVRLGLIAEEWSSISASQMRYTGEVISGEVTRRLADGVLRASGLSAWTQAGRWAFGMEFMAHLADNAAVPYAQLSKPLQKSLKRYAISESDWDKIRVTKPYRDDIGGFLRPDDVGDDALATKLLDMIQSETEFAVPSTSVLGKAQVVGDARPGTISGELTRSALMYKNFAITLFHTHMMRAATEVGPWDKFKYASSLLVHTTLMGALAIQLKDISRGKDPRPMGDDRYGVSPKFLTAAMLQGGGLGLFGDFLFSGSDRFGRSKVESLTGPMVGFGMDAIDLTLGNAMDAVKGETTNFGRDAVQFAGRYTPGSSLWYLRYMIERGILDATQRMVDPNAEKSFASRRQSWGTEQGADFFAPPGDGVTPSRGPDWANALRTHAEGQTVAKGRRYDVGVDDGQSMSEIEAAIELAKKAKGRKMDPLPGASAGDLQQAIDADKAGDKARRSMKTKTFRDKRRKQGYRAAPGTAEKKTSSPQGLVIPQ